MVAIFVLLSFYFMLGYFYQSYTYFAPRVAGSKLRDIGEDVIMTLDRLGKIRKYLYNYPIDARGLYMEIGEYMPADIGFRVRVLDRERNPIAEYGPFPPAETSVCVVDYLVAARSVAYNLTRVDYAYRGALWLESVALSDDICKWPLEEDSSGFVWVNSTGFSGAAGIGYFFVDLYLATKNETFLDYAEKVANWLSDLEQADIVHGGLKWPAWEGSNDFLTGMDGSAGIGLFYMELAYATGNYQYFEKAKAAAESLIGAANVTGPFVNWPRYLNGTGTIYTGFAGTAGVGYFLTKMYEVTGNSTYLHYARGAALWLALYNEGGRWRPAENMSGEPRYMGLGLGSAGIGLFFLELYRATGDSDYLSFAIQAGNWLISRAETTTHGVRWPESTARNYYPPGGGGTAGVVYFLWELYKATLDARYRDYAIMGLEWLMYVAEPVGSGYRWADDPSVPPGLKSYHTGFGADLPSTYAEISEYEISGTAGVAYAFLCTGWERGLYPFTLEISLWRLTG